MSGQLNSLIIPSQIPPPAQDAMVGAAARIVSGRLIPAQQQLLVLSSGEWEEFIREWVHFKKAIYPTVMRLSGANDMGVDVAGFTDGQGFQGIWDNFQCKYYDHAVTPKTAVEEIGKLLWHSFTKQYSAPRKYYFIAPRGCGMSLSRLLLDSDQLKSKVIADWDKTCSGSITSIKKVALIGPFLTYVQNFDFSIFTQQTTLQIIDEHRATPYYALRFGGGLPDRPLPQPPPHPSQDKDSRYVRQLFEAYEDHKGAPVADPSDLHQWPELRDHFHRQREAFYHAEALRNFARDNVPPGTYESLQSEVLDGVIDVNEKHHSDGYQRLIETIQAAVSLNLTANALISVTKVQDRKGICHQLADKDQVRWRKP